MAEPSANLLRESERERERGEGGDTSSRGSEICTLDGANQQRRQEQASRGNSGRLLSARTPQSRVRAHASRRVLEKALRPGDALPREINASRHTVC